MSDLKANPPSSAPTLESLLARLNATQKADFAANRYPERNGRPYPAYPTVTVGSGGGGVGGYIRQAAKMQNFGAPAPRHLIDGLTGKQCLERFEAFQREDFSHPPLTRAQREWASSMWSANLGLRVEFSEAEDRERDRLQVTVEIGPDDL